MHFRMFVSYSGKDLKKIKAFLDGLDAIPGLKYYLFDTTKTPAQHTKDDILKHIREADSYLLFHSINSKKSNFVQHEMGAAIVLTKPLIIAKLGRSKPDGMLQDYNYFDFSSKKKALSEMSRLTSFVHQKILERQQKIMVQNNSQSIPKPNNKVDWLLLLVVVGLLIYMVLMLSKTNQSGVPSLKA